MTESVTKHGEECEAIATLPDVPAAGDVHALDSSGNDEKCCSESNGSCQAASTKARKRAENEYAGQDRPREVDDERCRCVEPSEVSDHRLRVAKRLSDHVEESRGRVRALAWILLEVVLILARERR